MIPYPLMDSSQAPQITFFVESLEESRLSGDSRGQFLLDKLGNGDVVTAIREAHGRLSVAMSHREIANDSALVDWLREMNILDVGIDVWPTLPDEDGYWIHAGNMRKVHEAVFGIIEELERKRVDFQNVGLDLEFPIGLMQGGSTIDMIRQLMKIRPWQFSQTDAKAYLEDLVQQILGQSQYGVHTYEVPILSDNARLRQLLGIPQAPDVKPHNSRHKRVGLVYTSATPKIAMGDPGKFVKEYSAGHGRIPALGIVSASDINPGRNLGGKTRFLTDDELSRDMKAALEISPKEVFVFALNGKPVIDRTRIAIETAMGLHFPVSV